MRVEQSNQVKYVNSIYCKNQLVSKCAYTVQDCEPLIFKFYALRWFNETSDNCLPERVLPRLTLNALRASTHRQAYSLTLRIYVPQLDALATSYHFAGCVWHTNKTRSTER